MRHTGIYAALIFSSLLIAYPSISSSAQDDITILKYSLKPVEYVDSGIFVRTKWNLFLVNEAKTPVKFIVRIIFIDKDDNNVNEIKKKCDIEAGEIKKISDTTLLEEYIARRVVSTKVYINELNE